MTASRFFLYILANRPKGVLYIGVTNDLVRRVSEHKGKYVSGFTANYGVSKWFTLNNTRRSSKLGPASAR